MGALNVLTESNLSNKLISGDLSYKGDSDSILETSFLNDEEQLLKVFPRSVLSKSALAEEERIEKEITRVFGDLNSSCFNKIACINKGKVKNKEQTNQENADLTPSVSEDCSDDIQKGMSQLTLDMLINETKEAPSVLNNNDEDVNNVTKDNSSNLFNDEKDSVIPEGSDGNEPKETNKPFDNSGKLKETIELPNTSDLNTKEPDTVNEENSHISSTTTEQEQFKQKTTKSEESDSTSVILDSDKIIKKIMTEGNVVTIDFIAECIADRTITKYKHFELCIKDSWKLKPGKKPKHLAKLTSDAKGGDVSKPVQDMELLKQGLKNLLVKI